MITKVQIVIMSHLSDVQETVGDYHPTISQNNRHKLNFVKFLIQRYPNTLDKIDPDKEYADFQKTHPNL